MGKIQQIFLKLINDGGFSPFFMPFFTRKKQFKPTAISKTIQFKDNGMHSDIQIIIMKRGEKKINKNLQTQYHPGLLKKMLMLIYFLVSAE